MNYSEVQPIVLSIFTSIITGGFILVFIEIGNRKNRENDRHDGLMNPFMHKLSAYFRFMSWCRSRIIYPTGLDGYEKEFKKLIDIMGQYGGKLIVSGGDYLIDSFSAKQLNDIALDINNIWYYHDKMRPCRLGWEERPYSYGIDYVAKELEEIRPSYASETQNVGLIAKVSSGFYTDVYQLIEYETYRHEAYMREYRAQTVWTSIFFSFALLILCLMLFVQLPMLVLQVSSICVVLMLITSIVFLATDVKVFVEWRGKQNKRKEKRKEKREAKHYLKKQRKILKGEEKKNHPQK